MADRKRETLMNKVQAYSFVAHECALYLDCHPNNRKALEKHSRAVKMLGEATAEYENMYGPLTSNSPVNTQNGGWRWVSGAWPWQSIDETDKEEGR